MRFPCFLLALSLTFGAFQNAYSESEKAEKAGKEDTTHSTIQVKKSDPYFVIDLRANPTTGYSWFLGHYDSELVEPIKKNYEANRKDLIGSGGKERWSFKLKPKAFLVPQVTIIEMIYARPWSLENTMTKTFKVVTLGE